MLVEALTLGSKTELANNAESLLRVGPADLEAVMKHYNVTAEEVNEMIKHIRSWYEKQAHLPQEQLHDRFTLGFLLLQGFSVERTKKSIDNFYTIRQRLPELACGRLPDDESWLWYLQRFLFVLPKKTAENNRVCIFRLDKDEKYFDLTQAIKAAFLKNEYRVWNDIAKGDHWIIDLKNTTSQQALQMTPALISKIIFSWKSCFVVKLKSVHLLNMPSFCNAVYNIFKKALSAKLLDRIHFVKDEDLLNIFSKDILPKEYGGTEFSCQDVADAWMKNFDSEPWRNYFVEQETIASDESKRLTPGNADEVFGVHGSFRKLCVD